MLDQHQDLITQTASIQDQDQAQLIQLTMLDQHLGLDYSDGSYTRSRPGPSYTVNYARSRPGPNYSDGSYTRSRPGPAYAVNYGRVLLRSVYC